MDMKPYWLKPIKKIDELLLLVTIYSYVKEHGLPPTAEVLMGLKREFAPSLTRIDTLRMWLQRHRNRTIRRVNDHRLYRYELNRQGEKRIVFLVERRLRTATPLRHLGLPVDVNMVKLYMIARDLGKTVEKRLLLLDLLLGFLAA
jgi:hypothetical protein